LSKIYFTLEHDKAITEYVISTDNVERNKIYDSMILPVFKELIHKIVYTFKYTSLPNISILQEDCLVHLTTVLNKFDASRDSTGFSYFTVIAKNFFNAASKKNTNYLIKEVSYETNLFEIEHLLVDTNTYDEDREKSEFMYFLRKEMDTWDKGRKKNYLNDVDFKVLQAVRIIFDNSEGIEIITKKGVFLYLRNISNIDTKHISRSLKKFTIRYQTFKKEWDEGLINEQKYLE
jgi:hypothetical protein